MATLTPKQAAFCREFLVDLNATQAAARAGYSKRSAHKIGPKLVVKSGIAAEIERLTAERSARTDIAADDVLRRFWMIATADPNELIEHRRVCCRHCHGAGFGYQRTPRELDLDRKAHAAAAAKEASRPRPSPVEPFDEMGGPGYDPRKPPHPACPECHGEGVERTFPKDTRHLSPAARALYAGVKATKDGLEIRTHDQLAALTSVARHLGLFVDRVKAEHTGEGGKPIQHEHRGNVSVTAEDVALARAILGGPAGGVHPDGGPQPVHPPPAARQAAGVPAAR